LDAGYIRLLTSYRDLRDARDHLRSFDRHEQFVRASGAFKERVGTTYMGVGLGSEMGKNEQSCTNREYDLFHRVTVAELSPREAQPAAEHQRD
jgi:hypothetical protein